MWQLIKKSYKSLKKSEKKFILWLTIITLLISTIPILYGWLFTPQDLHYTGFTVIAGADKMVYFSQMEEAKQGNILFHNLYTPESEKARIFSPVWLALGWFSKITTLSKIATFHLFRIL